MEKNLWALILGSSSGFGEAVGLELARLGYNIVGVHFDRRSGLPHVEEVVQKMKETGRQVIFFNMNASDTDKRKEVITRIQQEFAKQPGTIRVLLHSLAFGTLQSLVASDSNVSKQQMEMTADVMGHSLVYWVQDLVQNALMESGGRIYAMTSSGGSRAMPHYGPVSAAKAILESHIRQLAVELAPLGITANSIRAGVTDTPALRKIPGSDKLIEAAIARNPYKRLTTTQDVAAAIGVLAQPNTYWITGNVLGVDGGEDIVG
ncbi:MAG: 3-oxoacyl-ACP reductase [Acidobacteria bacterium RIFCSPLOWO2_12_FULL_54_10]|nr:MAG: 3-oxoacyl-ACP reductase [Acidobacteria bacterium RIFCSPLOWO2_12_FULL_54_10]